jgi:hypothetical protein
MRGSESMNYLADRVRTLVAHDPRLTEKFMFGGHTFLINGHILAGCRPDGGMLISVGKDNHEAAKTRPGATEMTQRSRVMSGFFWIDPDAIEDDDDLADWIRFAERAVSQRPLKEPKPARSRKTPAPR